MYFSLLSLLFCFIAAFAMAQEACVERIRSKQLWVRHTEPKGIGYEQGYTTLQAFFLTSEAYGGFYPYGDLRAHIFNDGRYASNVGIGGRALSGNRIWGANLYYDARGTKRLTLNQLSCGFEALGPTWDFFLNGYLLVGRRNSPTLKVSFDRFENHFLFLKRHIDSGLSGADASVRIHFLNQEKSDLYFDIGPYYYRGSFGKHLIGGKASLSAIFYDLFFAEASESYDTLFKWIGQGILGLRFPLGKKLILPNCPQRDRSFATRLMQIPDHNEIIVVKRNHVSAEAIDPQTGEPYFFWFVNNLSSSSGTFESPFPTLAQAQAASSPRDIIYVFRGDGTTTNLSTGIVLKDFQQLLGSGISHDFNTTYGGISIPPLTDGFPVITNTAGTGVTLANGNIVAGMHIDQPMQFGISGVGVANATISNNIITEVILGAGDRMGLNLQGPGMSGTYLISDNQITGSAAATEMHGIFVIPKGSDICTISIINNVIDTPKDGVEFKPEGSSITTSVISGNSFTSRGLSDVGFFMENKNTSQHFFEIAQNTFTSAGTGLFIQPRDESRIQGTVSANECIHSLTGFRLEGAGTSTASIDVTNNSFSGNILFDFRGRTITSATLCFTLTNNQAPALGYQLQRQTATSVLNLTIFSGNTGALTDSGAFLFTQNPTCP